MLLKLGVRGDGIEPLRGVRLPDLAQRSGKACSLGCVAEALAVGRVRQDDGVVECTEFPDVGNLKAAAIPHARQLGVRVGQCHGGGVNVVADALERGVLADLVQGLLALLCPDVGGHKVEVLGGKAAVGITRQPVNPGWMRRIVQVGLSPAMIIALDNVLLISVNVMLHTYGGADSDMLIACAAVMQSFMLIITMPLGGITAGTQSILGYNYGAGNTKRILQAFRSIILLCLVFCGVMFAIAQTVSGSFVRIFTRDPAYIDMASYMIRTYSLGVLGLAVQYPAVDGMTGMGLIRWGLTFSMLRKGLFLVCVFVLPPLFGATAVMFSEPVSDITAAVFSAGGLAFVLPKLMRKREAEGK